VGCFRTDLLDHGGSSNELVRAGGQLVAVLLFAGGGQWGGKRWRREGRDLREKGF
jgi:hypothetical protein